MVIATSHTAMHGSTNIKKNDMIWYDMIYDWYMIWYDMMVWYDMIHDTIRHDMIYDMIYFLNAIGLTPGGSSTVHIYTQTIHRTNTNN